MLNIHTIAKNASIHACFHSYAIYTHSHSHSEHRFPAPSGCRKPVLGVSHTHTASIGFTGKCLSQQNSPSNTHSYLTHKSLPPYLIHTHTHSTDSPPPPPPPLCTLKSWNSHRNTGVRLITGCRKVHHRFLHK